MKTYRFVLLAAVNAALFLAGCDEGGGVLPGSLSPSAYVLQLPEVPADWASLLGAPDWRIEWLDSASEKQTRLIRGDERPEISPPETWTSPVTAWPCWPKRGIEPGVFRPAGGLFPFDASGGSLSVHWRGGVDAVLYWELAYAAAGDAENESPSRAAVPRLPQNFNWPRFRELFAEGSGINEDVRADPWLADWPVIAVKIARSGFDTRRLVPAPRGPLPVPAGSGPWIGSSPFAEPLCFEGPPQFPVRDATDTWVSARGIVRCNRAAWMILAWEPGVAD
ncbi:MAG: hypothetical protein LBD48_07750 [Treponema sp.]|jgi:hypothetical protein|nr:hypothetical protein [Treponema sp.]